MVFGIWLVLLGVLGAASLIVAKRPDAKDAIAKLAPYQGWIGAVSALWGVWGVISSVLSIGSIGLVWAMVLATSVLLAALGLLLGVGVLKTFIKDPTAQAKMDETITKLAPYQGTLGLASIGLGLAATVTSVLF